MKVLETLIRTEKNTRNFCGVEELAFVMFGGLFN